MRAIDRRGCRITDLNVMRLAGRGALLLSATCADGSIKDIELYSPTSAATPRCASCGGRSPARWRRRAVPRIDAPRRRAPRADGHRDRRARPRQHLAAGGDPTRSRWTLYAYPARAPPLDEATETTLVPRVWGALRPCTTTHLSRRPACQGHRRRRHGDIRRIRARRMKPPTRDAVRHRATAGDHDGAVRRTNHGTGGDGRLRRNSRPDRVAAARESGCAQAYREPIADYRGILFRCPRGGDAADGTRRDRDGDNHAVRTATRSCRWCFWSHWYTSRCRSISTVPTFLSELRTANYSSALLELVIWH